VPNAHAIVDGYLERYEKSRAQATEALKKYNETGDDSELASAILGDAIAGGLIGRLTGAKGGKSENPEQLKAIVERKVIAEDAVIDALQAIKKDLDAQHAETTKRFDAIEVRDKSSGRQAVWLTIVSSAITLLIGWLLAGLAAPAEVFHLVVR
jgi:hypothetical protein